MLCDLRMLSPALGGGSLSLLSAPLKGHLTHCIDCGKATTADSKLSGGREEGKEGPWLGPQPELLGCGFWEAAALVRLALE